MSAAERRSFAAKSRQAGAGIRKFEFALAKDRACGNVAVLPTENPVIAKLEEAAQPAASLSAILLTAWQYSDILLDRIVNTRLILQIFGELSF